MLDVFVAPRLPSLAVAATLRTVKYALLLAIALLAGCENQNTKPGPPTQKYTKLTVTDLTGDLVSEWIAEGRVKKSDQGYTIRAVERWTAPPYPIHSQFPNGRPSTVAGQNIVLEDVEKPAWLKKLDGER